MAPKSRKKPNAREDVFEELTFALENCEDCLEEAHDELAFVRKTLAQLQRRVLKLEAKAPPASPGARTPRARAKR